MEGDRSIQYNKRVLVGNWYETMQLEEYKTNLFLNQMKSGHLRLAKYRKLTENLNTPVELTQDPSVVRFGSKVSLLAPYAPGSKADFSINRIAIHPPHEGKVGLLLGGRLSHNDIQYHQDLMEGSAVVALRDITPKNRSAFTITSADYCDRKGETLKYNQEFILTLCSSQKPGKVPLYVRYDPDAIPGLTDINQLYLSKHAVSNARWRVLPILQPNITRFEREGEPVGVNTDVVVNHCSTNINLGVKVGVWRMGFHGRVCSLLMKTCLDVYKHELPSNIWRFYLPNTADSEKDTKS